MNIRSLLSLILLCATTFDVTLFAAKRSFDEVDDSELSVDNNFYDDDEQEDNKDNKPKSSSRSRKKTYPCKTCGKPFTDHSNRTRHERIHSGEEPYTCEHCGKSFKNSSNRVKHERTHSRIKFFSCQHCNKSFKNPTCGTKHQKKCTQNPSLSLLIPQQLALDQEAVDNSLLTPTLDPDTVFYANALVSLMQAGPTQEAESLPLLNPDAGNAEYYPQDNS